MPVARAMSTPVTSAAVSYIQRSPGWSTSGSEPSRRIHSSVGGSGRWTVPARPRSGGSPARPGPCRYRGCRSRSRRVIGRSPQRCRPAARGSRARHVRQLGRRSSTGSSRRRVLVLDERHRARRDDRFVIEPSRQIVSVPSASIGARAFERESAHRVDVDLAVPREHGDGTGDVPLVHALEHRCHPGRRRCAKPPSSHAGPYRVGVRRVRSHDDRRRSPVASRLTTLLHFFVVVEGGYRYATCRSPGRNHHVHDRRPAHGDGSPSSSTNERPADASTSTWRRTDRARRRGRSSRRARRVPRSDRSTTARSAGSRSPTRKAIGLHLPQQHRTLPHT